MAASPGQFLVSYSQYDAVLQKTRARMRLVSDPRVPQTCSEAGAPIMVLDVASPLTMECGLGVYVDPGARAFDACGNALEVHGYNTGARLVRAGPQHALRGHVLRLVRGLGRQMGQR